MSTDRRKKKRSVPRFERIKIIEYGCIGLVILLFVGLAILYGSKNRTAVEANADASPSSVPTPDEGNEDADKTVVIEGLDGYIVAASKDTLMVCRRKNEEQIFRFASDVELKKLLDKR